MLECISQSLKCLSWALSWPSTSYINEDFLGRGRYWCFGANGGLWFVQMSIGLGFFYSVSSSLQPPWPNGSRLCGGVRCPSQSVLLCTVKTLKD